MNDEPSLPTSERWSSIGVTLGAELQGGHQSRVFLAERFGERVVVKLTDGRFVDDSFRQRIEMSASLATVDESVVGPITTDAGLVADLEGWLAVVYPFVTGRMPAITDERDVRLMATTLADLHRSLRSLDAVELPPVVALADRTTDMTGFGEPQLLHGDFSPTNLLFSIDAIAVIDFAECGRGPVEFEVGNTLYMVLFDAAMSSQMDRFRQFRAWFVDSYRSASGRAVDDALLDRSIQLRVDALEHWLNDPESAPIGIRTATPTWRNTLRSLLPSLR